MTKGALFTNSFNCFHSKLELFVKLQIFYSSKFKDFADDNFEFEENGGKLSLRVENTVGKGEIACDEQSVLLPTVFSKDLYCRHVKTRLFWVWVNIVFACVSTFPCHHLV